MQERRKRAKARRRSNKLLEAAWEAVVGGDVARGAKLSRRAIEEDGTNPAAWNDAGLIQRRLGCVAEADRAFRQAIQLAPRFPEPWRNLAEIYLEEGKTAKAADYLRRSVELEPQDRALAERLARLEADLTGAVAPCVEDAEPAPPPGARTARYDWERLGAELITRGASVMPGLLTHAECRQLIACWSDELLFEHEVRLDDETGRVHYKFFARPLPDLVRDLRQEMYARLAPVANERQQRLDREPTFPAAHGDFLRRCRRAGQTRSTPILVRYESGGFNGLHRDIAGRLFFPFQLAVTLGPGSARRNEGGNLVLADVRPGKRPHRREIATDVGDGVVFCVQDRLRAVAGIWGLQPVLHGVTPVAAERFALGMPFHDFA